MAGPLPFYFASAGDRAQINLYGSITSALQKDGGGQSMQKHWYKLLYIEDDGPIIHTACVEVSNRFGSVNVHSQMRHPPTLPAHG